MTIDSITTGDPPTTGYYDAFGNWIQNTYIWPSWNPPVYIQPTYTPGTVIFYPDDGLKEEVRELKEEIKKLRKELAKK